MKKVVKSIVAIAIVICAILGLSACSSSERVNAQNQIKPSLTIENTTMFEFENVEVQLNKDQTIELGTIGKGESVNVPIQEDADPIVSTKIQGYNKILGNFAGSVTGWVKGGTEMQICLNENAKVYITSNVEAED